MGLGGQLRPSPSCLAGEKCGNAESPGQRVLASFAIAPRGSAGRENKRGVFLSWRRRCGGGVGMREREHMQTHTKAAGSSNWCNTHGLAQARAERGPLARREQGKGRIAAEEGRTGTGAPRERGRGLPTRRAGRKGELGGEGDRRGELPPTRSPSIRRESELSEPLSRATRDSRGLRCTQLRSTFRSQQLAFRA